MTMTRQQRTLVRNYFKIKEVYWNRPCTAHANELDQAEDALMREFLGATERVHNQRYGALRAALLVAGVLPNEE
jgi:hypothetical protein